MIGDYTDMAIEELGWDDNKRTRNVVNVRCNRAITMLGKMMGDARCDYRDVYVPIVIWPSRSLQDFPTRRGTPDSHSKYCMLSV